MHSSVFRFSLHRAGREVALSHTSVCSAFPESHKVMSKNSPSTVSPVECVQGLANANANASELLKVTHSNKMLANISRHHRSLKFSEYSNFTQASWLSLAIRRLVSRNWQKCMDTAWLTRSWIIWGQQEHLPFVRCAGCSQDSHMVLHCWRIQAEIQKHTHRHTLLNILRALQPCCLHGFTENIIKPHTHTDKAQTHQLAGKQTGYMMNEWINTPNKAITGVRLHQRIDMLRPLKFVTFLIPVGL